ncbi:MAG: DEAD/DEAH box helicase [Candidatus Latescibacteria bacterium]|nr:DEAD/DEAH box helicase [Candidatus Latescibacterota bacterium]
MTTKSNTNTLKLFHPLVSKWFRENVGTPTDIQNQAWPCIAEGKHVLVTAPTGSGKTLTAFLWAINNFLVDLNTIHPKRVLYISPLKALNNDIKRNLSEPLEGLRTFFEKTGESFPEIRIDVRSGDTDPGDRRRMLRHPPEIFITTPESLNVLLSSKSGEHLLSGFTTVILDEIHAVADVKRGTYLMTAIERLAPLCGEFQRIALSATVKPLEHIADFIGGYRIVRSKGEYHYEKRNVTILESKVKKKYQIDVNFPDTDTENKNNDAWWDSFINILRGRIDSNRSTLLFANNRRMVEKITRLINEKEETDKVYSHHGSLAKEIRSVVEHRLKNGELSAIVATSSLELGIDIGAVDEVILVQTPYSLASAIQRIGRAGHGVGQVSHGSFVPMHSRDLIEAAVLAANIDSGDIETIKPLENPLDVLAQVLLSETLHGHRDIDELYAEIRACSAYQNLSRKEFDLVVEMLAGRYADTRIRELKPRIKLDRLNNTIIANDNARILLYMSGGVIPDRGYYNLRVAESKAKIGELDEEFVWERSLGDAFPFGNQIWQILRITHNDVEVRQVTKSNSLVPFWKAEAFNRSFHVSEKIGLFLENANNRLKTGEFKEELMTVNHTEETAADSLIGFLDRQKESTGSLPHRHNLVIEHFHDPANISDSKQSLLHTLWGGQVNRPFAFALSAAWEEKYNYALETFVNNDCIMVNLPHDFTADEIFLLVESAEIPRLLRKKLESTGYFGAHFRENAQRALLLPRRNFRERMPRWINRLRSKKLLDAVSKFDDFPIVLETWRECFGYDFDLETLYQLMEEIRTGEICITEVNTQIPSPFADQILWRQTNYYMYDDDTPGSKLQTNLRDELLQEIIHSSHLRPRLSSDLIHSFEEKIQRTSEGYPPASPEDLLEWIKERLYIPAAEWEKLLQAIKRDYEIAPEKIVVPITGQMYRIERDNSLVAVVALENIPRVAEALEIEVHDIDSITGKIKRPRKSSEMEENPLAAFLYEWLRFYGPVTHEFLLAALHVDQKKLTNALEKLLDERNIIIDEFRVPEVTASQTAVQQEICDNKNLEILLRMRRNAERPVFEPLNINTLQLFLAYHQGLVSIGESSEDLQERLDMLLGYPARVSLWETDILPARLSPYYTSWLDSVMHECDLIWFGCGKERISLCFEADYELYAETFETTDKNNENVLYKSVHELKQIFSVMVGKIGFADIARLSRIPVDTLSDGLWQLVWEGSVTNDDFNTLRRGILNRFRSEKLPEQSGRRHRPGFNRWKNARPFTGNWYMLPKADMGTSDALDRQEFIKDRIRQLFLRYGILFRELLRNELPSLQWGSIFRTLRLMELSGEVFTGHFFKGLYGLQFCTHGALRVLNKPLPNDTIYWMNATDPASLCSLGIDDLKGVLPARLPTTHLVYHGQNLVLISKRSGNELLFRVGPETELIGEYLEMFNVQLSRQFQPQKIIKVETVNDVPVFESPYLKALKNFGFKKDYKAVVLRKKY